ncbi:metal-dependent hydrolase [Halocalculus aciditolerans]|nr:metal-dependent hydrolase [Halocalculus aciditolerans]
MATTHGLVGLAFAAGVAATTRDPAPVVLWTGLLGGVLPDLDLYWGHRKTLHFPVYYTATAALAGGLWTATAATGIETLSASTALLALAVLLGAAAVHSVMDAFGGGLELRPWEGTSDRAVYSHFHGRWLPPKRWIRYDGAPEDLGLAAVAAAPALLATTGVVRHAALLALCVSAGYVLVRKPMVRVTEWVVARTPDRVLGYVPERFVADLR